MTNAPRPTSQETSLMRLDVEINVYTRHAKVLICPGKIDGNGF